MPGPQEHRDGRANLNNQTNIDRWEEAVRAHGEFVGEIREHGRLIRPEMLVEIEADAVFDG